MNEVTKIHLGRQSFTVSVEAHKALQVYLHAIERQVGDKGKDVVEEVELRMAELLTERGVSGDKVVLAKDVDYLKEQLGSPKDFKEDGGDDEPSERTKQKRLFRDTEHGMIAGVAAGLANFFGIDAAIVRLLFVLGVVTGGWGIVLYIVLWLVVPEAKTSSDRLQMSGKAVNLNTIKEVVDRADVPGAAHRAGGVVRGILATLFMVFMVTTGLLFILGALGILFTTIALGVYALLHDGKFIQEGLFPVGNSEVLLLAIGLAVSVIVAVLLLLVGVAMIRRKWQLPGWGLAALIGLLFVGLSVGTALTADAVPRVRDRYEAAHHTSSRSVEAFNEVYLTGDDVRLEYKKSDTYKVEFSYVGAPDLSIIKTKVEGQKLTIDTQDFANDDNCTMLCLFHNYDLKIMVYAPELTNSEVLNKALLWRWQAPADPANPFTDNS